MLKASGGFTFWDDLENEARRLVGLDYSSDKKSIAGSKYYPLGTIKAYDNSGKGWSGLKGIKVIATRGFTSKSAITNASGYFYINHGFGGAVNYKIKWERDDYDIRSGTYGQAYYNGPKQESAWNLNISSGSIDWCYAMIHRAAYHYYYNHWDYGIQAPPRQGGILNQRLHIGAMDKSGTSHYYDFNSFFFAAQVKIYCKWSSGSYKSSKSLYAVSIHELAYASHWELGYSTAQYLVDLIFSNAKIPESWAECVEHIIVSDVYGGSWDNNQTISLSDNTRYTAFFIDLIDSFNQSDHYSNRPVDNVEGYTLSELEYALDKTYIDLCPYGLSALEPIWETFAPTILRNKLENLYDNETEEYLEELFDNYF